MLKEDLSLIEDSKNNYKKLDIYAKQAVKNAIQESKDKQVEITYLSNQQVVQELPSGQIIVLKELPNQRRKVQVGSKAKF